jgi:hypothetical protein
MLFALRRISTRELIAPSALEVTDDRIAMVHRLLGWSVGIHKRARLELISARLSPARRIVAGDIPVDFSVEKAVRDSVHDLDDEVLVLLFDDAPDREAWVLSGPRAEMERAQAELRPGPRPVAAAPDEADTGEIPVPSTVEEPPRDLELLRLLTAVGVVCTVLGTLFLLLGG